MNCRMTRMVSIGEGIEVVFGDGMEFQLRESENTGRF